MGEEVFQVNLHFTAKIKPCLHVAFLSLLFYKKKEKEKNYADAFCALNAALLKK